MFKKYLTFYKDFVFLLLKTKQFPKRFYIRKTVPKDIILKNNSKKKCSNVKCCLIIKSLVYKKNFIVFKCTAKSADFH